MQKGKFYLYACPFFWTWVGEYVMHLNFQEVVIADAMYFTRTGATFDILCDKGLILGGDQESLICPIRRDLMLADGAKVRNGAIIPAQGPKLAWGAATPWVKNER